MDRTNNSDGNPILASDKHYWHGFAKFYEAELPPALDGLIVEIGLLNGDSTRWLASKYPAARLVCADIETDNPNWPRSPRISYEWLDQGQPRSVAALFKKIEAPQLVLEDGSHCPAHQSLCLKLGLKHLAPGGLYVLEDIHTSFPQHPLYHEEFIKQGKSPSQQTSLSVLLAFEHLQRLDQRELDERLLERLGCGEHFSKRDIAAMFASIERIVFYKRPNLPERCYCGSSDFDYHKMRCSCGKWLLAQADSMTALVFKKP